MYIDYHFKTIYLTVVLCVYITVLYLFYIKRWFTNLFSFHFLRMRMCTHDNQTMVTEISKTINFWYCFVYNMVVYRMAILFIGIMLLYWQVFLRRVKATNEISTLLTHYTYNTSLDWLTNLAMSTMCQVLFLWKLLHNQTCLFGYVPITNVFECICTVFAHLMIGCAWKSGTYATVSLFSSIQFHRNQQSH